MIFKMKKINRLNANVVSPWVDIDFQYTIPMIIILYEHCKDQQKCSNPNCGSAQYNATINYASLKLSKEISFGILL
jgi:hypothetical protein